MRKIPTCMIRPEMKLAKSIYHNDRLLVAEGTTNLDRFIDTLTRFGIYYVYICDAISEGIEIPDVISDKTRLQCKHALFGMINKLKTEGTLNIEPLFNTIDSLLDEIMNRPEILVNLTEIGSTDDSTLVHSVNTTVYALMIGSKLGYSKNDLRRLAEGTLLHDIGKTLIDQKILQKPGRLTQTEFEHVKLHTTLGYDLLKKNPLLTELTRIIALSHHERLDGSGYPHSYTGDDIHEFVRIVSIADVYESLTSDRCYRRSLCPFDAIQILTEESTAKLHAHLTAIFIRNIAIYPNGTMVRLSDNRYAIVKEQNNQMPYRPVVRILKQMKDKFIPTEEINLMTELNLTIKEPNITTINKN